MNNDQIAHDLAIAYINNRYSVDVRGEFSVTSSTNENNAVDDVSGSGSIETTHLPDVNAPVMLKVGTGQRHFRFGPEKTQWVPTDEFQVDRVFRDMINDYRAAYARFLQLLAGR
jgi:hypothetical protein